MSKKVEEKIEEEHKNKNILMIKNAFGTFGNYLLNQTYKDVDYELAKSFINENAAIEV